jgi:DNA adenine methylase
MTYPGGKGGAGVAQLIINQQPPHSHYVEPFFGGGAVMLMKRPAFWNTGIDLEPSTIAKMSEAAGFSFLCDDGIAWLAEATLRPDALVYCDPPYLMKTRASQRRLYKCEFDEDDHWRLLCVLRNLKCMVQISGYWSSLYAKRLEGWRLVRFQSMTRGGVREECLWMNYAEPAALHDYRFLGRTFRERERIHRKTARWCSRIAALPSLEKTALLSAMMANHAKSGDVARLQCPLAGSNDARSRSGNAENGEGCRPVSLDVTMLPATSPVSTVIDRSSAETAVLQ